MKKILVIALITILLCVSWTSWAYGDDSIGTLEIITSKDTLATGENFKIELKTNDIEGIYGMDITISFDPEVIEAKNLEMTLKLIDKNHFVAINKIDDKGSIRLAFTLLGNEKPLDKNIEIGSIPFRSVKEKSSSIKIIKSRLLTKEGKEIIHNLKECTLTTVDKMSSHPQNSTKINNKVIMKIKEGNNKLEFDDINGHWAEKWIETLNLMGVVNGKSENLFCPEESITRAEIAKMLDLCLHWNIPSSGKSYEFKDEYIIPKWSKSHVDNLVAKGIICGYDDNTFKPNKKVTREELAVFIDRMLNLPIEPNANIEKFSDDNNISQWCKSSVYRVKNLGIVNGYKDNAFKGKNTVTRAEACKVIVKLLEVMDYL